MMLGPLTQPDVARALPASGVRLAFAGNEQRFDRRERTPTVKDAVSEFPRRPDAAVLSETIALFFYRTEQKRAMGGARGRTPMWRHLPTKAISIVVRRNEKQTGRMRDDVAYRTLRA